MLSREYNERLFHEKSRGADVAVVEGVMGLFDGYDGLSESGSTAQMAKWLNLPVVLVVDAKGMARSGAAVVKGFEAFDPDLNIAGVIFTRVGSQRHYEYLKPAVEQSCNAVCLGYLPRNDEIRMPERHLGLVTAQEHRIDQKVIDILTAMVRDHIDMDGLLDMISPVSTGRYAIEDKQSENRKSDRPVIVVPKDKAFCFYYEDNLEILEKNGARIAEFSMLESSSLPEPVHGIYLGGGYPEVYAAELSAKTGLLKQIRAFSDDGMPIYGECGGFMLLCRSLTGMDGKTAWPMTGCFDVDVTMSKRLRSLGYREVKLKKDTIVGTRGDVIRGHEFHYSSIKNMAGGIPDIYEVSSRSGQDISLKGLQVNNTLGSYLHVHFASNENCARRFVDACKSYRDRQKV